MKKGVKKIIGGVILFAGGMVLTFSFIIFLILQNDDITFRAPGSIEVSVEEPGRYYLWNDYCTVFDGRSYSFGKELPHGLTFSLTENESGLAVPMKADSSISSESGSKKKSSIGYFEITKAGQYTVHISGDTEDRIFSFGKSFFGNGALFFGGLAAVVLFDFAVAIGALLLIIFGIVDLVRESKTANQQVEQSAAK